MALKDPSRTPLAKAVVKAMDEIITTKAAQNDLDLQQGFQELVASRNEIRDVLNQGKVKGSQLGATLEELVEGQLLAEVTTSDGGRSFGLTELGWKRSQLLPETTFGTDIEVVKKEAAKIRQDTGATLPPGTIRIVSAIMKPINERAWKKLWQTHLDKIEAGEKLGYNEEGVATKYVQSQEAVNTLLSAELEAKVEEAKRTPIPPKPDDWQPRRGNIDPGLSGPDL